MQLNSCKVCLAFLIIYILGNNHLFVQKRRISLDEGREGTTEEKSLQIINRNSVFKIDSFCLDFPGEPISASC
jgi:hypothetical protein